MDEELLAITLSTRVKTMWPYRRDWNSDVEKYEDKTKWCYEKCRGEWRWNGTHWSFKNDQDYVMFILRWGDGRY